MGSEMVRNFSKGIELVRAEPISCHAKNYAYLFISLIPSLKIFIEHLLCTSNVLGVGDTVMAKTDTAPDLKLHISIAR